MSSELMKKVTGFVLIALLLCSLSFLLKLCLVPVTYRKLVVSSRIFTCASRSINFLSPLQLQRAQLQEWASDQGCSLHLSHWARVFLCHLMLHELLGGFFSSFSPFPGHCGLMFGQGLFSLYFLQKSRWASPCLNCGLPAHIFILHYLARRTLKWRLFIPPYGDMDGLQNIKIYIFQLCRLCFLLGIEDGGNPVNQKANVIASSE